MHPVAYIRLALLDGEQYLNSVTEVKPPKCSSELKKTLRRHVQNNYKEIQVLSNNLLTNLDFDATSTIARTCFRFKTRNEVRISNIDFVSFFAHIALHWVGYFDTSCERTKQLKNDK